MCLPQSERGQKSSSEAKHVAELQKEVCSRRIHFLSPLSLPCTQATSCSVCCVLALCAPPAGRGEVVLPQRTAVYTGDRERQFQLSLPWLGWEWGRTRAPGPRPPGSYLGRERSKEQKGLGGWTTASGCILASALPRTLAGRTVASTPGE